MGLLSRLAPLEEMGADLVPNLKPRLRSDKDPQRSPNGTDARVITGIDDGTEPPRLRRMLSNDGRGARNQILMKSLVLFGTDGITEGVAEDGINLDRTRRRGWIRVWGRHDEDAEMLIPNRAGL